MIADTAVNDLSAVLTFPVRAAATLIGGYRRFRRAGDRIDRSTGESSVLSRGPSTRLGRDPGRGHGTRSECRPAGDGTRSVRTQVTDRQAATVGHAFRHRSGTHASPYSRAEGHSIQDARPLNALVRSAISPGPPPALLWPEPLTGRSPWRPQRSPWRHR